MNDFDHIVTPVASASDVKPDTVRKQVAAERQRSKNAPVANFEETLINTFDADTVSAIMQTLAHLQLPIPDENVEFLRAYEGAIFFSNQYGMVVRIEPIDKNIKLGTCARQPVVRINDNPWVLQPIGSIVAGEAIVEICPGVHTTDQSSDLTALAQGLKRTGAHLYDLSCSNIGRLPIATKNFPDGIPVVLDRLSVQRLTSTTRNIRNALQDMHIDVAPQKQLYGALKRLFSQAWPKDAMIPDATKMAEFWRAMGKAAQDGVLVAGWNARIKDEYKIIDARISATAYDQKLRKSFRAAATRKTGKATTGANLRTSSGQAPGKK